MDLTGRTPVVPGRQIGHYAILRRLGQGGMGEVFLALDRKLDRHVALKVLSADVVTDGDRLRMFQREARALAALNHPGIVTIFSVEEADEIHLLVMEFVEGRTLRDVLAAGGLPLSQFFQIVVPLTEALAAAHEQGITHRDLKPENVMLTQSGRVKVLDFGLAKIVQPARPESDASSLVATIAGPGAVLGTVPYLSPEQAEGRTVDHRSDIFSLGVVLHELATGQRPFTGDSAAHVVAAILRDHPEPVERLRPDAPAALGELIRRCLEKDPQRRIQSVRLLHRELEEIAAESIPVYTSRLGRHPMGAPAPASTAISTGGWLQSRWGLTALLGLVFIVNLIETAAENALQSSPGAGRDVTYAIARAQRWFEGGLSFDHHDVANATAVYGYSSVYFFLLPLMLAAALIGFARRDDIRAYRVMCVSLAVTYAVSFIFYVSFPVLERWAFPESEAILLSDLWSSRLIAAIRPISGLDNCFPSFHVASAVVTALVCWMFQARFRGLAAVAAVSVLLSTFVLGIHWLPDMIAGACLAVISLWAALRIERRLVTTGAPSEHRQHVTRGML